MPVPLDHLGDVLGALGVARHAGQAALNAALRAGELRLAHSDAGVLVVAAEAGAGP